MAVSTGEADQHIAPAQDRPTPPLRWRRVAIVAGLFGVVFAVLVPFLPVEQNQSRIDWPQAGSARSVEAPLVSYTPVRFDAQIPCAAATALAQRGGVVVGTGPNGGPNTERYGFVAKVVAASTDGPGRLDIILRDRVLAAIPLDQLGNCSIAVSSDVTRTTVQRSDASAPSVLEGDFRPQVVGIFTTIVSAPNGLSVSVEVDSRFSSTPSMLKRLAILAAVVSVLIALVALYKLDGVDGRRSRRFLPARWWRFRAVDGVVVGTLVLWHFIGATTADDGYIFGMARTADRAGYMANYFRYFGVPETPFGTPYYDVFGLLAQVSTASPFVRLPTLLAGIVAWLLISREVVPRLGSAARRGSLPLWTGGLVFLAFWLPYDNGLRPDPAVAVGVLLTWCSVERAIATRRLLPAAVAILVGGLTLTAGPSGLICFAALIAGLRPIVQIIVARARFAGYVALLAPLFAAGAVILTVVFADQTFAATLEMQRVHEFAGPSDKWFSEYLRYQYLFNISVDGSLSRRFGVFVMVLAIAVSILVMVRRGGRIPGLAAGPPRRLIGITLGAMALMMFTPTKWTHHFGIYAGLAGSLAVVAAVAVGRSTLRSPRNRALFAAAVLFALTMSFISINGWWYVSSWGVPFWDKPPSVAGLGVGTMLFGATLAMLGAAVWYHVREPHAPNVSSRLLAAPPLTIAAAFMVVFEVASFAKGAVAQYPAYSLALSNFSALAAEPCGLANHVLLETDPNASMLQPLSGERARGLEASNVGFGPNGVAADLSSEEEATTSGTANSVDTDDEQDETTNSSAGTTGGQLPFGLDPSTTPMLGSFGNPSSAALTTGWYTLPSVRGDLISIAAAGRIRSVDADGVVTPGQNLEVEYGALGPDGSVAPLGKTTPIDIGPTPSWRNLRVPMSALPPEAVVVRLVASDNDRNPDQWLAVTPPRVPQTRTLNDVVGSDAPVLLDWAVGLVFPCQRPFDHHVGVAEVPKYRIQPDRNGAATTTLWQDHFGGGPLGWTDMLLAARTIPSYLRNDWDKDWGEIVQYSPIDPSAVPAVIGTSTVERSGLWTPGPIKTSS